MGKAILLPVRDGKAEFDRGLGEHVRRARERAGVKQEQLGRAVGLSRTSITNIEHGRQGVQAYLLVRIAETLGCSPAHLLPGERTGPAALPDKVQELEPTKREWAKRVLSSSKEDDDDAA